MVQVQISTLIQSRSYLFNRNANNHIARIVFTILYVPIVYDWDFFIHLQLTIHHRLPIEFNLIPIYVIIYLLN